MEGTMPTPTVEAVAERLDGLERQNHRMLWIVAGLFLTSVVIAAEMRRTMSPRPGVVEAKQVVIRDKEGRLRGVFGLDATEQPGLKMFDGNGREQVALEIPCENSSTLAFFDRGETRLLLDSSADGSSALRLYDKEQQSSSSLFMWPDGRTGMSFKMNKHGLVMGIQPDGGSALYITDRSGTENGRVGAATVNDRTLGLVAGPVVSTPEPALAPTPQQPLHKPTILLDRPTEP
jgi:hypothetical protein